MTATAKPVPSLVSIARRPALALPVAVAVVAFVVLFAKPAQLMVHDWWTNPEAGHGLLLAPLAVWLGWRRGLRTDRRPQVMSGVLLLAAAVLLRYLSGLAAEVFTMRVSMLMALAALVVFLWGWRQLLYWWLSVALLFLSIPWPALITNALALPLQFQASRMGAALLRSRDIPVLLSGNVINLPGHQLFVTEACSGLRSLTALLSLGLLVGGLWLRTPVARVLLLLLAIPVAIVINAIRVFFTGFLVYFVDPKLGEGFMHMTEGWLLFIVAFGLLALLAWAARAIEHRLGKEPLDA
ncbi:MAG TPA: exosortase/archaeosortase family protein [Gemmatimonadales bacterium]|jgi:exosortase|nr:exosortase/archaeosortase family protein [Gemmatimonadales bacterium]